MYNKPMDWDGDVVEMAKTAKTAIETAKTAMDWDGDTAKQMADELWNAEIKKSTEEAVHDNMHPQRWA